MARQDADETDLVVARAENLERRTQMVRSSLPKRMRLPGAAVPASAVRCQALWMPRRHQGNVWHLSNNSTGKTCLLLYMQRAGRRGLPGVPSFNVRDQPLPRDVCASRPILRMRRVSAVQRIAHAQQRLSWGLSRQIWCEAGCDGNAVHGHLPGLTVGCCRPRRAMHCVVPPSAVEPCGDQQMTRLQSCTI